MEVLPAVMGWLLILAEDLPLPLVSVIMRYDVKWWRNVKCQENVSNEVISLDQILSTSNMRVMRIM